MFNFKTPPLKIDYSHKIVRMTEQQVAENKYQLKKDYPCGYMTKHKSYGVSICLAYGNYALGYAMILVILWYAIRSLQYLYEPDKEQDLKALTARLYHIHQLLIPDIVITDIPDISEAFADYYGLTLLKEIISMSDEEREALINYDREIEQKEYPNADRVTIYGEDMVVYGLAYVLEIGCDFMILEAAKAPLESRSASIFREIIPGMFFSAILKGYTEEDAFDFTIQHIPPIDEKIVKDIIKYIRV